MPSAPDHSSLALSSASPGRRIISRLTSPFASKSRNVVDYYIQLEDQHKQYSPGDVVTGSIRLRIAKPIRVTHIVVCLHGYVQVFKNPGSPGEVFRGNPGYRGVGRGKKSGEYFGNGFASLFEDEVVLCGDGKLAEGSYQFNFELEFPDRDLPSSIDFERGTITYVITATMTRPTTIAPTTSCDRKVYFVERIDISPIYPPKPRTIILEPITKRSRAKQQALKLVDASERRSRKTDSAQQSEQQHENITVPGPSMQVEATTPLSPAPSEISFGSRTSSSNGRASQPESASLSPESSNNPKPIHSKTSIGGRSITATVESLTGGCLRGDSIPIRVSINHTKHVKSLYGVILTLYRHARVDMHPAIPLGPAEKGGNPKYEDYFPKSVTGLGGLSLSGAGSSHTFRKDLSQTMHPLIIDPTTLTAEINAKVRVPEDLFPTISTVPGGMISFKYFVEVIVDIQGKLAGHDRNLGNFGGFSSSNVAPFDRFEGERSAFTQYGSTVIDTSTVRRDKSVIASVFEVIIGTQDSERRKGKRKLDGVAQPETPQSRAQQTPADDYIAAGHESNNQSEYHDTGWYQQRYRSTLTQPPGESEPSGYHDHAYRAPAYDHPPPELPYLALPDESELTEKERVMLAEARLLPSQPPGMEEQAGEGAHEASAPYLPDEAAMAAAPVSGLSAPIYTAKPLALALRRVQGASSDSPPAASTAPMYLSPAAGSSTQAATRNFDDKQERQRQYLKMEASAPPLDKDDTDSSAMIPDHGPSAPTFDGSDETTAEMYESHAEAAGSSGLPGYER